MWENYYIVFVVVIVVILFLMVGWLFGQQTDLMRGFWRADSDFMEMADLKEFILFIDADLKNGYLFLTSTENVDIYNGPVSMEISRLEYNFMSQCKYKFTLKDVDCFPDPMTAVFDPVSMSMVLYKDDAICASLYKDRFATKAVFNTEKIKPDSDSSEPA